MLFPPFKGVLPFFFARSSFPRLPHVSEIDCKPLCGYGLWSVPDLALYLFWHYTTDAILY